MDRKQSLFFNQQSFGFDGSTSPAGATISPNQTMPNGTVTGGSTGSAADMSDAKRNVKLPSTVPEQVRGERPYYHECYFKYCTTALAMKEASLVTEILTNASAVFFAKCAEREGDSNEALCAPHYEGAPPFGPTFGWNERFQTDASKPTKALRLHSAWDERQSIFKKFEESVVQTCEQAVFCVQRFFRGRQALPLDLIAIESTTSFVSQAFGALIHVWHCATEAMKFVTSQNVMAETVSRLRLVDVHVPYTVSFVIHTFTVTATALVPLTSAKRVQVAGPQLLRQVKQLEMYSRARCSLQIHAGADGRWYVLDTQPVLRAESESQGETNNCARHCVFDTFPNMDDFPDTLRKAGRKMLEMVVTTLIDEVQRHADAAGGLGATKVHDLVASRLFARTLHQYGFKVSYAYELLEHPKLNVNSSGFMLPTAGVVRELICAEMVCRTMKEIIRAELATMRTVLHPEAPIPVVAQLIVEVSNRSVFNLLTKEDLWVPHVMSILRIKFSTPEQFAISQAAVTKRTILGYLSARLGLIFEGGRYARTAPVVGRSSMVQPCAVTSLMIKGHNSEALALAKDQWKQAVDITNPDMQFAAMRHRMHLFTLCNSEDDVSMGIAAIEQKMNDRSSDLATRSDACVAFLDAYASMLPNKNQGACRKLVNEYTKKMVRQFLAHPHDLPQAMWNTLLVIRVVSELQPQAAAAAAAAAASQSAIFPSTSAAVSSSFSGGDAGEGAQAITSPTSATPTSQSSPALAAVSSLRPAEEVDELRKVAYEYWQKLKDGSFKAPPSSGGFSPASSFPGSTQDQGEGGSMWLSTSLTADDVFELLLTVFERFFQKEGSIHTSAKLLKYLTQGKSTPLRFRRVAATLLRCAIVSIGEENALPANQRTFYRDIAQEALDVHELLYAPTEVPYFVALLTLVAQKLSMDRPGMSMRASIDCDNFNRTIKPILLQYISLADDVREAAMWRLLGSPDVLASVGTIINVLMDLSEWKYTKDLLAFTHHVVCEGKVDGYSRLAEPAHPCLKEVAATMKAALAAARRFQGVLQRSIATKKEGVAKAMEARRKREASGFNRSTLLYGKPVPINLLFHAAQECHETTVRTDNSFMPRIAAITEFASTSTLSGLRTLLSCSNTKTYALAAVAMQSSYFPPIKFSVVPFTYGHRHIVVVPDSQCVGLFWSKLWLIPSRMHDTNVPLYAKVAAQYICSQVRFSHLFFSVIGFGWGGPIAQCLVPMIPAAEMQVLLTLGSPPAFVPPVSFTVSAVHSHYSLEEDLVPHLLGCSQGSHIRNRLMAKLEGFGCLSPFPPTKRQLSGLSQLRYYGEHISMLRRGADGVVRDRQSFDGDEFSKSIDLRKQFVGMNPMHYVDAIAAYIKQHPEEYDGDISGAAKMSMFSVAMSAVTDNKQRHGGNNGSSPAAVTMSMHTPWYPAEVPLLQAELSADGNPTDKLRSILKIPASVEANVAQPELMLLEYPKVAQRIVRGTLILNDEYGLDSDGVANQVCIERILKCRSQDQLVAVLQSYVGASWYPEFLAVQLCEWCGVTQGLNRQSLIAPFIESFVAKHSFLWTMCPETSTKSSSVSSTVVSAGNENTSLLDRLSKQMSDADKVKFVGPLGYHVGWSIAVARTLSSVETSRVVQALLNAQCQTGGISDMHARTARGMFAPAVRFVWTPPQQKQLAPSVAGAGRGTGHSTANNKAAWSLVQWNLLEVTFDGSNAGQSLLRGAEQCLWVVQDEYTLQHFVSSVDCSDANSMRQYLVYCASASAQGEAPSSPAGGQTATMESSPSGTVSPTKQNPAISTAQKAKAFADAHNMPFYELQASRPESVVGLVTMLMKEISTFVRLPVNPSQLPKNVHCGAMYAHDDDEVQRQVKRGMTFFIKPNTPGEGTRMQTMKVKEAAQAVNSGRRGR